MKTEIYYEIDGLHKHAELDNWQEGCDPDTGAISDVSTVFRNADLKELINEVKDMFCIEDVEDAENVDLNACDELGRVDFQVYEDANGFIATEDELNLWKAGHKELWLCTYTGHVSKITKESEFNLEHA